MNGLTDVQIVDKFRAVGYNLPEDAIVVNLPKVTLKDKIKKIENEDILTQAPWKQEVGQFVNWPRTVNIPVTYKYPENELELQQILKSSPDNEKVGVMGSGHSWSNIFVDRDGILINMDSYFPSGYGGRKVKVIPGPEHKLAISPGCSFKMKHNQLLEDYGKDDYVLPSNVIYTDIHYVGVASGGCHVSSRNYK